MKSDRQKFRRKKNPLYVTFDTNAYSVVGRPQMQRIFAKSWPLNRARWSSKVQRLIWWYLNRCVRLGRIVAGMPEPALKAEVLPNAQRISLLISVGTAQAGILPAVAPTRRQIIEAAFDYGFRVMRSPRIGYGAVYPVPQCSWAADIRYSRADRQARESVFVRHFNNYPLENLRDFGEQMSAAHGLGMRPQNAGYLLAAQMNGITLDRYLWRVGLEAEENTPICHASLADYQQRLRTLLSDWVDFDIVAVHHAYGYDILCSDENRRDRPNSIFGPTYAGTLSSTFDVKVMRISELARVCWKQFGFPIWNWRKP